MDGKILVSVRLAKTGLAVLDDMAAEEGVDRSVLIRTLLSEAIQARRAKRRTK